MNISSNFLSLQDYCKFFSKIKVNKTKDKGIAPYKPLLLLSIIDLISEGEIQDRKIYVTQKLVDRFEHYRDLLSSNAFDGNLVLPFFHLKNDGFWKLEFSEAYNGGRPQTIPKLKSDVDYALIDEQLFYLLQTEDSKKQLIDTLLEVYFASSNKKTIEIVEINDNFSKYEHDNINIKQQPPNQQKDIYFKQSIVRNAFFRKSVVQIYEHHCALCKMRVCSTIGQNIVDGAHIKPLSLFNDNDIRNGVSLCKNHHWAFDNGLFAIDNDYTVIVAKDFTEESPNTKSIKEFDGEKLLLPTLKKFHPRLDALQWHRDRFFLD